MPDMPQFDRYTVVSFDLWDTVLRRDCHPEEIKIASAAALVDTLSCDLKPEFKSPEKIRLERNRIEAEIAAETRAAGRDDEYDIRDVLRRLAVRAAVRDLAPAEAERIADHVFAEEITAEMRVTRVDRDAATMLEASRGHPRFLISDFYIPGADLARLLDHHSLSGHFDALHVSCEIGFNKKSGRLFDHVRLTHSIDPARWLHIGDNAHADVEMARNAGIEAHHHVIEHEEARRCQLVESFALRPFAPHQVLPALALAASPQADSPLADEETAPFGLLLAGFAGCLVRDRAVSIACVGAGAPFLATALRAAAPEDAPRIVVGTPSAGAGAVFAGFDAEAAARDPAVKESAGGGVLSPLRVAGASADLAARLEPRLERLFGGAAPATGAAFQERVVAAVRSASSAARKRAISAVLVAASALEPTRARLESGPTAAPRTICGTTLATETLPAAAPLLGVVVHELAPTGAPQFGLRLARALARRGWNIAVYAKEDGALRDHPMFSEHGAPLVVTSSGHVRRTKRADALAAAEAALAARPPDLLYVHSLAAIEWCEAAAHHGVPAVLHAHEAPKLARELRRAGLFEASLRIRIAGLVGAAAPALAFARRLVAPPGAPELLCPNFIDFEALTMSRGEALPPARNALGDRLEAGRPRPLVAMCGPATHAKGFDIFLCLARRRPEVDCLWMGPFEPIDRTGRTAEALVLKAKLPNLWVTGPVASPAPWFDRADALVFTSRFEASPTVVLEALALGLPVIGFPSVLGDPSALRRFGKSLPGWPHSRRLAAAVDRIVSDGGLLAPRSSPAGFLKERDAPAVVGRIDAFLRTAGATASGQCRVAVE